MFEISECHVLTRQVNEAIAGKVVQSSSLGNSPHKFVWHNLSHEEFATLTPGKSIGSAYALGRWMLIPIEPGYVMVVGEWGGKLQLLPAGASTPPKYHFIIQFTDGTMLYGLTQMWGAVELYPAGQEQERQYIKGMRPTPLNTAFTLEYFSNLIEELLQGQKRSVKSLLTQDQLIPGLGNSIAQDILFNAGLHPRHPLAELSGQQPQRLYTAITETVHQVIAAGGRYDEQDLFGKPGGYVRLMDAKSAGQPCPVCDTVIQKMQYLGGACYFCPSCQI